MRAYLLKVFGIFLITGAGELLLPEGNIKKYAKVLLSVLVCHALLTPIGVIPDFEIEAITEDAMVHDTFESDVYEEYKKRIEENIFEKTGQRCTVILKDDGSIEKIITEDEPDIAVIMYFANELGVKKDDIEVGKN